MMDLAEIFKEFTFYETDGFRYVTVKKPSQAFKALMEEVCFLYPGNPEKKGGGFYEYQIDVNNSRADRVVAFIDKNRDKKRDFN